MNDVKFPEHIAEAIAERQFYGDEWDERLASDKLRSRWAKEQYRTAYRVEGIATPEMYTDNDFRVVMPVSGGLDSTAMYLMAQDAGKEVRPVYVDAGQPYAQDELAALDSMGILPAVIAIEPSPVASGTHIIFGRNTRIIMECAKYGAGVGAWGEIWFGNVMGESYVIGSDKSSRYFNTLQGVLTAEGYDFRICTPLATLTKVDIVRWYVSNGYEALLAKVRPCLADSGKPCGECGSCLKMIMACVLVGVNWQKIYDRAEIPALRAFAEKMEYSVSREPGRWAPKEVRENTEALAVLRAQGAF